MSSEPLVYIVSNDLLDADIGEGRDDNPDMSIPDKIRKAASDWGRMFPGLSLSIVRIPDPDVEVAADTRPPIQIVEEEEGDLDEWIDPVPPAPSYPDLFSIIEVEEAAHPDAYRGWEQEVAEPALNDLGYRVISWRTGESDSFGPLSRIVDVSKDGETCSFIYF